MFIAQSIESRKEEGARACTSCLPEVQTLLIAVPSVVMPSGDRGVAGVTARIHMAHSRNAVDLPI